MNIDVKIPKLLLVLNILTTYNVIRVPRALLLIAKTALLKVLAGELEPKSGLVKFGSTVRLSYFPKNHDSYFENDLSLFEWLREYSENKEETSYVVS